MAGTEDITLRVALDDRQAKAGLEALRVQTTAVATAADGGAGGFGKLGNRIDKINKVAGPAASAISGVTGAIGGMNTQAGAAVGAVANLAGAFAAGGLLSLGIAAVGTGLSLLTTRYQESTKAAEEAQKKQTEALNAIIKAGLSPLEAATLDLTRAQKDLELKRMLTGGDSDAIVNAVRPITLELETLQVQIGASERELKRFKSEAVRGIRPGESLEEYKAARAFAEEQMKATEGNISLLRQAFNIRANTINLVTDSAQAEIDLRNKIKAKEKAERDHEKAIKDAKKEQEDQLKMQQEAVDLAKDYASQRRKQIMDETAAIGPTREMFEQAQLKQFQDAEKAKADAARKAAEERVKIEEEAAKRIEDIQTKTTQVGVDAASGATALLIGTVNDLVIGAVSGQEMAAEKAAAAFLSGIGNQLVGIGTKALIEGAIISANPLTPGAGAPMMGLGALAIATGIGLGAAGAGISTAIAGAPTGAGTAGPSPATTATPMGAGRISSGGRDGGGPMQEAITYVFNAPVFGDQNRSARQVAMLQRRAPL